MKSIDLFAGAGEHAIKLCDNLYGCFYGDFFIFMKSKTSKITKSDPCAIKNSSAKAKMKDQVLEGVFEAYGPNESYSHVRICDYIDFNGNRIPSVKWDMSIAYQIENSLGKNIRLSFWGNRIAAIEVDGKITKSTWNGESGELAFISIIGIIGLLIASVAINDTFYKVGFFKHALMLLTCLSPALLFLLYRNKNRRDFKAAANALG